MLAWSLLKWGSLGAIVGILAGSASALFLFALDAATATRETHPWLLWLLPVGGGLIGLLYHRFGRSVEAGSNLLFEQIHDPRETVPVRMAPLVLLGTVATHLFGGSAGREGTAVQMGGSLADLLPAPLHLSGADRRLLLMAGMSGGFGAVFGTPLAGAVFGLEAPNVGRLRHDALVPCLAASWVGDLVCRAWGVHHHPYLVGQVPLLTPPTLALVLLLGVLSGLVALLFGELTHAIHHLFSRVVSVAWLRPVLGGICVILLAVAVGTRDYLGLSLPLIERCFTPGTIFLGAFALKLLFTTVTLGSGFKGGEVTPLFCIGATLGAALAQVTGQPVPFFAALGFVAVFAGAANTPLACTLMGMELFGAPLAMPLAATCGISYILSGHGGIYLAQRVDTPKATGLRLGKGLPLRAARQGALEVQSLRFRRLSPRGSGEAEPPDSE